jgi:hypothetical protein
MHRIRKRTKTLLFSGMLTLCVAAGCAGHTSRTTQTVTTQQSGTTAGANEEHPAASNRTVTTTTTTDSDEKSPGIVGSAFSLVWAVISFPFRVIGALF